MWLEFYRFSFQKRMIMRNIPGQRVIQPIRYEDMCPTRARVCQPGHCRRQESADARGARRTEILIEPIHDEQKMSLFLGGPLRCLLPERREFQGKLLRDCRLAEYLGELLNDSRQEQFSVSMSLAPRDEVRDDVNLLGEPSSHELSKQGSLAGILLSHEQSVALASLSEGYQFAKFAFSVF